ncbi:MAG TPA: DUF5667 domain-containing protein [Pseudonocardia sp.]|nr:DUF5667 domain-containing protein [Pseudonocardia sp.]
MPAGWGEEERFAAAMESGPTSVGDDGSDGLARELEIAALLRSAGPALSPAPAAKARAKQRLMAAFAEEHGAGHADDTGPIAVTTSVALADRPRDRHAEPTPLRARAGGRHAFPEAPADEPEAETDLGPSVRRLRRTRPERGGHRRAALFGAAAAAALVALAGTGTFASRDALPGDPMYGVKRVAESTGYALTFGEQAKARRHLEQAQRRLDEVEGLVSRDQGTQAGVAPVDPTEQQLVRSTMQEFDSNANEGSRLLLSGPAPDAAQVDDVRQWATEQSARLSGMRSAIPAQDKADESLALLNRLLGEADALQKASCDPSAGPCPTARDGEPAEGDSENGQTLVPDATVPGPTESRSTTRGGGSGSADDPADDDAPSVDDEQSSSSDDSDDESTDGRRRDGSGGSGSSGGSGGGEAGGSGGEVSVPLLPLPVKVPSVAGLPGVKLG